MPNGCVLSVEQKRPVTTLLALVICGIVFLLVSDPPVEVA